MSKNNFFILGSMKCGTTSLFTSLRQHPDICMASEKEPVFFELDREYAKGKEYYLKKYFEHHSDEPWLGEARPRNLFLPWVPERILEMFPEARFIVILRNPVRRAYSFYWASKRSGISGTETRDFSEAIFENYRRLKNGRTFDTGEMKAWYQEAYEVRGDGKFKTYLEEGYYYKLIKRYVNLSSRSRIKVVLLNDYIENPLEVCNELFEFLGLESLDSLEEEHRMESFRTRWQSLQRAFVVARKLASDLSIYDYIPKSLLKTIQKINIGSKSLPEMDPLVNLWLHEHFRPKNRELETFLGRDLDHWKMELDESPKEGS